MKNNFLFYSLYAAALLFTGNAFAQRIIYNSREAISGSKNNNIIDVQVLTLANHKLVILKKGGIKEKFDYGTGKIWGYENKQHEIYRLYKRQFYLVKNISGPVFIYITRSPDLLKRNVVTKDNYFFSKSLDSDILVFNKRSLLMAFKNEKCLSGVISRFKGDSFTETPVRNAEKIDSLMYRDCPAAIRKSPSNL